MHIHIHAYALYTIFDNIKYLETLLHLIDSEMLKLKHLFLDQQKYIFQKFN